MYYPEGKDAVRLTGLKEYKIVEEGIGRKFQVPSVFVNLTVLDNMILSLKGHKGIFDSIFGKPETFRTGEILKEIKKECTVIVIEHDMDFVKQAADIVTVLHEGIQPSIIQDIGTAIRKINEWKGITVLLVEQYLDFVLENADMIYVMEKGSIVFTGQRSEDDHNTIRQLMTE